MAARLALVLLLAALPAAAKAAASGAVGCADAYTHADCRPSQGLPPIRSVSASYLMTAAVSRDGCAFAWEGAVPDDLRDIVKLQVGTGGGVALLGDGSVRSWGSSGTIVPPSGLGSIVDVATDGSAFFAVGAAGSLTAWGTGPAATLPAGIASVGSVVAYQGRAVAVLRDGTVVEWGSAATGLAPGASGIAAVALGQSHAIALKTDGTVIAVGSNAAGQCAVPAGLSGVVAISADSDCSIALTGDGTVVAWGDIDPPPVGLADVTAIAAGFGRGVAVKADGSVVAWGVDSDRGLLQPPLGLPPVAAIGAGVFHALAVLTDGTVRAWGRDREGQCDVPAGLDGVIAVAGGWYHSLALRSDGSIVGWGSGSAAAVPPGLGAATAIACGRTHSLALLSDGSVVGWGDDSLSQSTPYLFTLPKPMAGIAAGGNQSLAFSPSESVYAWGMMLNAAPVASIPGSRGACGLITEIMVSSTGQVRGSGSSIYGFANGGLASSWLVGTWPVTAVASEDFVAYLLTSDGEVHGDRAGPMVSLYDGVSGIACANASLLMLGDDHAPNDIVASSLAIPENSPPGTVIGTLATSDEDAGDTAAYLLQPLISGTHGIVVSGSSLVATQALDHEITPYVSLLVSATDSRGMSTRRQLVVTVSDVDEAPTDIILSGATLAERSAPGTPVGNLTAVDEDRGDTHVFSLVAGAGADANADFAIVGAQLRAASPLSSDSSPYSIRVRATDGGGLSCEKVFAITATATPDGRSLTQGGANGGQPSGARCGAGGLVAALGLAALGIARRRRQS